MNSEVYFSRKDHLEQSEPNGALNCRLEELLKDARAKEVLQTDPAGLRILSGGPWRTTDVARAVRLIENVVEASRPRLAIEALLGADDIVSHPGFANVHLELEAEEEHLLKLRTRIAANAGEGS